ncbi:MAG: hypothetical protein MZV65_40115 [Chromatiales bacterium]|nr:hypothetical protein [Chromatiales bacterium]
MRGGLAAGGHSTDGPGRPGPDRAVAGATAGRADLQRLQVLREGLRRALLDHGDHRGGHPPVRLAHPGRGAARRARFLRLQRPRSTIMPACAASVGWGTSTPACWCCSMATAPTTSSTIRASSAPKR